ncbi:hybrid sensor histidine kinase/response regulator [uncultured Roseibium sp.]|uniref:ATP-binding response regulator n=1 Tax=uncultured Roseibium sp. TaxID=1936171 RepID=UPI00262B6076|nr:hybrid sensor histidine kinase/response regulator [uncultured Roseibium sp.]
MPDHDDDNARLALLAHDLRTPLFAMRLTADLIGNGSLDDDQAEKLAILIKSIDSLTEMTGDLVETASAGHASSTGPQSIIALVTECADLFRIAAENKGLAFDVRIDAQLRDLWTAHPIELRRILMAVLDNAIKYTETGKVSVSVQQSMHSEAGDQNRTDQAFACIAVSDTGPGIDPDEEVHLFRPFSRGRRGASAVAGHGLGLWGATRLVEVLRGRLFLRRPADGGSCFEIHIPASTSEAAPVPEAAPGLTASNKENTRGLKAHVLIVDDNATNCRLMAALLETFGCTFDVSQSGEDALALIGARDYDAILLDLNMPGKSGIETALEVKADPSKSGLPLIAVTAALEGVSERQLREAGFRETVTKPLSPTDLYAALVRACSDPA